MKLSIEQANKLLSALVSDVAVVANDAEADADVNLDQVATQLTDKVSAALRSTIEEEAKADFEQNFIGRYSGALRSAAQRVFNVHKRELEDMNFEELLTKCKTAIEDNFTAADTERVAQMETTISEYEAQLDQIKSNYETQLAQERGKYTQQAIADRCLNMIQQLPRKGGDLQEQAEMLRDRMQKVYEVRYNETTKQLEFYKEGAPAISDNNEPVTDEGFARTWAERAGILVHDTRHLSPAAIKAGQQPAFAQGLIIPDDGPNSPLDAIQAWTEESR
ncbi:MAG: hypothetical protein R2800_08020 [Flavipsychrobacter sp.]